MKKNFLLAFFTVLCLSNNTFSQTILWQNGFESPSEWTQVNNPGHTAGDWLFLTGLPTFDPLYQQQLQGLPSTFSAATGNFAFISYDTGINAPIDTQDAYLELNSFIDLSTAGSATLELSFNDFYKDYFNQFLYVEISNDGGGTWTVYEVNADVVPNADCTDGEIESFLLSPAGGVWTNQVIIRFRYQGQFAWFWGIDNVKIKTLPNFDLRLNDVSWGSTGAYGIRMGYYEVPTSQIAPVEFSGEVINWGNQNQNNAVLNVNSAGFSSNSVPSPIISADSVILSSGVFNPSASGTYSFNASVSSPNTDALPANNSLNNFASISIGQGLVYSREDGIPNASGGFIPSYFGGNYETGNVFDVFTNTVLNGISFMPMGSAETEVVVRLYYAVPGDLDFDNYWLYEQVYTLQSSDIGQIITIPFSEPQNLTAGASYLVTASTFSSSTWIAESNLTSEIGNSIFNQYSSCVRNNVNNQWYYTTMKPIVRMNLCNVYNANSSITVNQCDSYISPAGNTYTSSGIYTDVIPVANGCGDSTITINLSITNSVQTTFSETICDGEIFSWNNQDYTYSGWFTQTFSAANGCDSIVALYLTVNYNDYIQIQANPAFGNSPLNVAFNNQTSNLSDYNFTWYFGDGTSQQSNSPFLSHTYTQDGYADVTLVAENITTGCVTSNIYNDMIFVIGGVTCTHTATLNQSGPLSACAGDSVLLSCNTDPSFSYQWNRNGVPVSGATSSSIYAQLSGSYTVTIYQNNCPVTSNGISVTFNPLPSIPTITSTGTITSCSGGSLTLDAPSGLSTYSWNTGATTASIVVTQSGNYTVTVTNSNGCARTSAPYVVNASFMPSPNVCIVGMDSLTNENRIVWEKPMTLGIDSFYVYKETNVSDVYTKIGATDYPDLAVFLDENSNPAVQAYRYKLTVLDTCGTETPLSDFHKTIHLTINAGVGGAWNLIWSHYEGLTFGSYNIYRGTDPSNISLLTTIQSNLNSYTDLTPPVGPVYYQIEIVNTNDCDPTKVVGYNVSRSNIVTNSGAGNLTISEENLILIYPNPFTNNLTLEVSEQWIGKTYVLMDNLGRTIAEDKFVSKKQAIELENLASGVYFIKIEKSGKLHKVVKR